MLAFLVALFFSVLVAAKDYGWPVYIINNSEDGRQYIEAVLGTNVTIVPALHGSDLESLYQELEGLVSLPRLKRFRDRETLRLFKANIENLAATVSHLRAVKKAYDDGSEYAFVFEDDISDFLSSFWPVPISELPQILDSYNPDWDLLRLNWWSKNWDAVKTTWRDHVQKFLNETSDNDRSLYYQEWQEYRTFPHDAVPLALPENEGYGTAAILYSRRGLKKILDAHYTGAEAGRLWRCVAGISCLADLSFFQATGPKTTYVSTPPYFLRRLAELKKRPRKAVLRRQGLIAMSLHWATEFVEILAPNGEHLPRNIEFYPRRY